MTEKQTDYTDIINELINIDISKIKKPFPEVGDFHSSNAVAFYGYKYAHDAYVSDPIKFKDEVRGVAKRMGLALCYGLGWKGMLQVTNNDEEQAKTLHANFFKNLPVVKANMDELIKKTKKDLFLTNLFRRRLYVKAWANTEDWKFQVAARNNTLNFGIQSLGADIVKLVAYKEDKFIEENRMYKNAGNLITKNFVARILTIDITEKEPDFVDELEFQLDCLDDGHTLILLIENDKVVQQFDRPVQIPMSLITEYNMHIYF